MTNQNNAAQPVLTDEEINAACCRLAADTGWHAENDRKKARAVESALLSKLRAEGVQAGDEREAFEAAMQMRGQNIYRWPNPHGGYRNSTTEMAWYAWSDRAALASVPACSEATDADLDKLYRETITEGPENDILCWENPHRLYARAVLARYARAALASAPVAGEAECKPCNGMGIKDGVGDRCEYCDGTGDVHSIDGEWRGTCICPADRAKVAPQASEAVRNALDYEKMRDVLQWIVDDAGSGGVAKLRPQQEKRALAALAAQPAKEPAISLHSPAARTRQLGGSECAETGNNDGGTHG